MSTPVKILAFAGSTRTGSYNKKLALAAAEAARTAGAEVTFADLRDFPMPLYDGDLEKEHGLPEATQQLRALLLAHDGLILSSPEYNSSISGVLKNAIDWASRPVPSETPLACFDGKVAVLLSASPGALGGIRGLASVRSILGNMKVIVLPDQLAVSKAQEAFDENGGLKDEKQRKTLESITSRLVQTLTRLKK
jgi:chromate reductase, NAD(P)H dehydrogenase (quinone)